MNQRDLGFKLIDKLKQLGADYVDLRYHLFDETESITTQNGELAKHQLSSQTGLGIRVLYKGGWGFSSGENPAQLEQLGLMALAQAKESARFRQFPVTLAAKDKVLGHFKSSPKIDPWESSLDSKIKRLLEVDALMQADFVDLRQIHTFFTKKNILFLDSLGSEIQKELLDVALSFYLYGLDQDKERQRRSFQLYHDTNSTLGLEALFNQKLESEALRIKNELHHILEAPACKQATCDVILMPEMMALQTHETIGHALELDRILGYELSYAGGSHVTLSDFGKLQFGSTKLNAWADGTTPNSPGSTGFDDDGVACKKMPLIEKGKLVGAITSSQMIMEANQKAKRTIFTESGGANRASSYNRFPIERMNNINIDPGEDGTLEEIIAQTSDGMILETPRSWSIGPNRENFHFATEIGWKIKNGKIDHVIKNPTYSGESLKFWHSLDKVGSDQSWQLQQVFNCGKGQPNQFMRLGHGVPICRFSDVEVGK